MNALIKKFFSDIKTTFKWDFLSRAQQTIISAAIVLSLSSGISAILGLVKGRLLTTYFGVSPELGVFYTADRIPSLIYGILVVGAISTVFIPLFSEEIKENNNKTWETASAIINVGMIVFAGLSLLTAIFAKPIIYYISLTKFDETQITLGANLMRIMVVGQIVLVASSFITSILHTYKKFIAPALAPILYNVGMIGGIVFFSEPFGIYGPAYGIIIGAILHLLIQIPVLKKLDFKYYPNFNIYTAKVQNLFKLLPPRIGSVLIANLIATINNSLAILISTPAVVILKFANQLQYFPVHLFGAAIATASLPVLSEHSKDTDIKKFTTIFITTFHQMMFLVIPASVILIILRVPIVRLVYGVDNFPWEATVKTSYALAFFSISIFAQSAFYLLTRAFYSLKDTVTPVKVSLVTICLNIFLSIYFVNNLKWGVWSLALSFSITSIIDSTVLMYLLLKKLNTFPLSNLLIPFVKISYSALFMGVCLYLPLKFLDKEILDTSLTINLIILTLLSSFFGIISYLFFTYIFKVREIELFYKLMNKLKLSKFVTPHQAINTPETI